MNSILKRRLPLLVVTAAVLIFCTVSYAWLADVEKRARTDYLLVDTPPILFVRDFEANRDDSIQVLNMENLTLGETKRIVFCVIPKSSGLIQEYKLEIIYTDNMHETMTLYRVDSVLKNQQPAAGTPYESVAASNGTDTFYYTYNKDDSITGDDKRVALVPSSVTTPQYVTEESITVNYDGNYMLYEDEVFLDNGTPVLTGADNLPGNQENIEMNCYVLEISWENSIVPSSVDPKEVDIVYVIVKGTTTTAG